MVYLEEQPALIVKIGSSHTIFAIVNGRGCIWRFISNEEIYTVKLEKLISDKIHYDSDAEQSRQLRALLALTEEQDEMIEENRIKDRSQDEHIIAIEEYNKSQDKKMEIHKNHLEKMIKDLETKIQKAES